MTPEIKISLRSLSFLHRTSERETKEKYLHRYYTITFAYPST